MEPKIKVVIVEDEPASKEYLIDLLTTYFRQIEIVAVEDTVDAAIQAICRYNPGLVFIDVEIKMGTGFDVLAGVEHIDFDTIFTTAFNQFAIDAFQYSAVDYLLKPLDAEKVVKAVQRSIERVSVKRSNDELRQLIQYLKRPVQLQRLPVSTMYGLEFIDIEDILFAEAEGNYCRVKLRSGRDIVITKKIKELEETLPDTLFMRVHNSYLVNTSYIRKYHKGRGGHIILDDESAIPVSPARKDDFLKRFDQRL